MDTFRALRGAPPASLVSARLCINTKFLAPNQHDREDDTISQIEEVLKSESELAR